MQEQQLTADHHGHTLNHTQVFSPDDQWIVYDTRNHDTHISRTCCIEKVNVETGEVIRLYSTTGQTVHGPGVGAASWNPREEKIVFIHGLLNCNEENPYGFTRRFGALVDVAHPGKMVHAEARKITGELISGALRGGTHAHSWSGDGAWISFTYNDLIMEKLQTSSGGAVKDLRTIGVMSPVKEVIVTNQSAENFSGEYFSVVAATVTEDPRPGSDEIEKAFDECWIGRQGYTRPDGSHQKRAIAFQAHVRDSHDSLVTEIFIADLPDEITVAPEGKRLEGTTSTRPSVPHGLVQRRLTFTADRKYPGLQGPRFWLRTSPDGSIIYFLMKDDKGSVQIWRIPVNGGSPEPVTRFPHPVQSQFNVSPDGKFIAVVADNSIWLTDTETGVSKRLTARSQDSDAPVGAPVWSNKGSLIAYNRYVDFQSDRYLQIFTLRVN